VEEHYQSAGKNGTIRIRFERSEITLDIPDVGLMTGGWRITPFSRPTVSEAKHAMYTVQLLVQYNTVACMHQITCAL